MYRRILGNVTEFVRLNSSLIEVYAPTAASYDGIQDFYDLLDTTITKERRANQLIVMATSIVR